MNNDLNKYLTNLTDWVIIALGTSLFFWRRLRPRVAMKVKADIDYQLERERERERDERQVTWVVRGFYIFCVFWFAYGAHHIYYG